MSTHTHARLLTKPTITPQTLQKIQQLRQNGYTLKKAAGTAGISLSKLKSNLRLLNSQQTPGNFSWAKHKNLVTPI